MYDRFLRVYRIYATLLRLFAIVAGLATFAIMWIIGINAFSRFVFNQPLVGAVEVTQSLLTILIMLPFAYAMLKGNHVNTVLVTNHFSPSTQRWLHSFWMAFGCILFVMVAYGTFQFALRSYNMNEQVWGANIRFPLWPAKMAVSFGAILLAIQCLMDLIRNIVVKDIDTLYEFHDASADEVKLDF